MLKFLILVAVLFAVALGLHWLKATSGEVALTFGDTVYAVDLTTAAIGFVALVIAALVAGADRRRDPARAAPLRARLAPAHRSSAAAHAISQGLIAVAAGDVRAAERAVLEASRRTPDLPLARLLQAQSAQLKGDRAAARLAFQDMTEDPADAHRRPARPLYRGGAGGRAGGRPPHRRAGARGIARHALGGARAAPPPDGGRRLGRSAEDAFGRRRRARARQAHGAPAARRHPHRRGAGEGGRRARPRPPCGAGGARAGARPRAGRRGGRAAALAAGRHPPRHPHPGGGLEGRPASRARRRLHARARRRFGERPAEAGRNALPHAHATPTRAGSPSPTRRSMRATSPAPARC